MFHPLSHIDRDNCSFFVKHATQLGKCYLYAVFMYRSKCGIHFVQSFYMCNFLFKMYWHILLSSLSISNIMHLHMSIFQNHILHFSDYFRCDCTLQTPSTWIILNAFIDTFKLSHQFPTSGLWSRKITIDFMSLEWISVSLKPFVKNFISAQ